MQFCPTEPCSKAKPFWTSEPAPASCPCSARRPELPGCSPSKPAGPRKSPDNWSTKIIFPTSSKYVAYVRRRDQLAWYELMSNLNVCFQVVYSKVEDVTLPFQVDIIISEWMGFYMLHESMLDSVLVARDKFLKPNGLMFPSHCTLYASPCSLPDLYSEWDNVCGVKMRSFARALRNLYLNKPKIMSVQLENLLAQNVSPIIELDLQHCQPQQLDEITAQRYLTVLEKSGIYQGVCFWFDVQFPTIDSTLSTSPGSPLTHWKQTTIVLPTQLEVEEGDAVMFNVQFKRSSPNSRHYSINLEMLDAENEPHPNPCNCNQTKCKIIKTFLSATQNVSEDEDDDEPDMASDNNEDES